MSKPRASRLVAGAVFLSLGLVGCGPEVSRGSPRTTSSLTAVVGAAVRERRTVMWNACRTRRGDIALVMFRPATGAGDYYEAAGDRIVVHKLVAAPDGAFGRVTPRGVVGFRRPSEGALISLTLRAAFHVAAGGDLSQATSAAAPDCHEDDWRPLSPGTGVPPPPPE